MSKVCGATLALGDDYGDNSSTFRCQLPLGHKGMHKEKFGVKGKERIMRWVGDDRKICYFCGEKTEEYCCCQNYHEGSLCPIIYKDVCPKCTSKIGKFEGRRWCCSDECWQQVQKRHRDLEKKYNL